MLKLIKNGVGLVRRWPFLGSTGAYNGLSSLENGVSKDRQQFTEKASIAGQAPLRAGPIVKRAIIRKRIGVPPSESISEPVRTAVATCTAQAYDIERLGKYLKRQYDGDTTCIQEDVWHASFGVNGLESFFFGDGCFVLWGGSEDITNKLATLKQELKPFEVSPLHMMENETLIFREQTAERFFAGIEGETIILDVPSNEKLEGIRAKLAFSNGLADSVKLAVLENSLEEHIERIKPIPLALASGSSLAVSRAKVLQLTGELLKFRAELNLHSELTDTPDMYWSEPQLEELYHRVARVLDIRHRGHILNKRLDYANELVSVLREHLSEQHGLKLEWGIIALIGVEVAFQTLHWIVELSK